MSTLNQCIQDFMALKPTVNLRTNKQTKVKQKKKNEKVENLNLCFCGGMHILIFIYQYYLSFIVTFLY